MPFLIVHIYYRDMTCFDCLYLKKLCTTWSIVGQNIDGKRSTAWRAVMIHSVLSITLLLASFDVVLPSECKKQS